MGDVGAQDLVAPFGIGFGTPPRAAPVTALAVRALREIHGVPEFGGDKFGGVVIDADHAATACCKFGGGAFDPIVAVLHRRAAIQGRPHGEPAHVVNVKQATVPERLIIEPYLRAFIQVDWNAHSTQGGVGLGSPGASRLAIATGAHSKDALDIYRSSALAALELGGAFDISEIPEIDRWRGWNAMEIGVIADVVQGDGPHHVPTPELLEYARFFANDFESSANAKSRQIACKTQGGVIGSGFHVILGVEPENHVDGAGGTQNMNRQNDHEQSDSNLHIQLSPGRRAPGSPPMPVENTNRLMRTVGDPRKPLLMITHTRTRRGILPQCFLYGVNSARPPFISMLTARVGSQPFKSATSIQSPKANRSKFA